MIDGYVDHAEIADHFANVFKDIYKGSEADDKLRRSFEGTFHSFQAKHHNDSLIPQSPPLYID